MPSHKNSLVRALALAFPLVFAVPAVVHAADDAPQAAQGQQTVVPGPGARSPQQQVQELNAQQQTPALQDGDKGMEVVRAQVLLDRAWFGPGQIDGYFGGNMKQAVLAFQQAHGLEASGRVDAATWQALAQGAQQPLFTVYTLQREDVGPFQDIPDKPQQQAKLERLGYESTVEELGEKFHSDPDLLVAMNKGRPAKVGVQIVVPVVGGDKPQGVTRLHLDKSQKMLYLLGQDGAVRGAFPVSIGDSKDPLPDKTLKITSHVPNPDFRYQADLLRGYEGDPVRVPPGPNNPVGVMWMELSKPHWGIHGNPEPSEMRRVTTNGCVRLTNWDALRVASVVEIGTPVEVTG